jgi:hypothetical protein
MKVLVDYDNVSMSTSRQVLAYLVNLILTKVSPVLRDIATVDLLLYGGWYQNNEMTRRANNYLFCLI